MNITIRAVDYHRNGVAGEGFFVVLFGWRDGRRTRNMVATVFEPPESCRVAILDVDETSATNIAFGMGNSWRGDDFAPQLWEAIHERNEALDDKLVTS